MNEKWRMPNGYQDEEAKIEANRCLSCKNPRCETGCPTHMRIRDFIQALKNGDRKEASSIIHSCSSLPHICSIVCPHERQCVGHCILNAKQKPIQIGRLERYVTEQDPVKIKPAQSLGKRVAVIGTGPAGISCAKELSIGGVSVDMYEATSGFGGILTYGIPNYRLDKQYVEKSLAELKALSVQIFYDRKMDEQAILQLKDTYDAVFMATGLPKVRKLNIDHEDANGVYDALAFLKTVNEAVKENKGTLPVWDNTTTVVVGAGNVAMDAARCAVRLGSEVIVIYRRSEQEAPATKEEITLARQEGVSFRFLTNPVAVLVSKNQTVSGVRCEMMKLGEPDESGRRRPIGTKEYVDIHCDRFISAIGQVAEDIYNAKVLQTDHLYLVCQDFKTSVDRIYAGGDLVNSSQTVVEAMVSGRTVASMILKEFNA